MILSNSNGRYPQGFQTPGIVRQWQQANGGAHGRTRVTDDAQQFATWFQDDWRATSQLTLEPRRALRHRLQLLRSGELREQRDAARARGDRQSVRRAARRRRPRTSRRASASPTTCPATAGGCCAAATASTSTSTTPRRRRGDITSQNRRPLNALATLTNTAIGVGQLATYRFGIDPLPPQPTEGNSLPRGSAGQWLRSGHRRIRAPTRRTSATPTQLAANTMLVGRLHARRGAQRAPARSTSIRSSTARACWRPTSSGSSACRTYLNDVNILSVDQQVAVRRADVQVPAALAARDAAGALHARGRLCVRRLDRQSLAGRAAGAGCSSTRSRDGEWGPTGSDERHRVVAMGVFELPYGIQLSPVFQAASARPYNLTAGTDLNADGTNNDRWIDPATGQQVSVNAGRGRQHGRPRPAHDEVLRARRRATDRRVCRVLQRVQHGELRRAVQRQRPERDVPAADRVRPRHRLPAPGSSSARGSCSRLALPACIRIEPGAGGRSTRHPANHGFVIAGSRKSSIIWRVVPLARLLTAPIPA